MVQSYYYYSFCGTQLVYWGDKVDIKEICITFFKNFVINWYNISSCGNIYLRCLS